MSSRSRSQRPEVWSYREWHWTCNECGGTSEYWSRPYESKEEAEEELARHKASDECYGNDED